MPDLATMLVPARAPVSPRILSRFSGVPTLLEDEVRECFARQHDARICVQGSRGAGKTVARSRFLGLAIESRHVVFVLDGSGSMARRLKDGRTRWMEACEALEKALVALGPAIGNVVVFQDAVQAAFPETVRLTSGRRKRLAGWLTGLRPRGRTALFDGLAAAEGKLFASMMDGSVICLGKED